MKENLNRKTVYSVYRKLPFVYIAIIISVTFVLKVSSKSIMNIVMRNGYSDEVAVTAFRYIAVIVYVVTLFIFSLSFYFFVKKEIDYSLLFPILVVVLGLIYLVIITPFSPPDEVTHYLATYRVSNMLLFKDPDLADSALLNYDVFTVHNNTLHSFLQVFANIAFPAETGSTIQVNSIVSLSHSYPLEYIGPAIGFTVARLLRCNFMFSFYFGRLFGLIFFVFCVFLSIRRIPKFKLTLGLLSITPMALQQAASYSYDGFINGVSLFLISSLIYIYVNEYEITLSDYLCVLIPAMLLAPAKGAFGFIILPTIILFMLVIPVTKYSNWKKKTIFIILIAVCITGMFFIFKSSTIIGEAFPNAKQSLDSVHGNKNELLGIKKIIYEPVTTLRVFQSTLHNSAISWLFGSIGSVLSGMSLSVPSWIILLYVLVISLSVFRGKEKVSTFSPFTRIILFFGVLSYIVVVMVSMYLSFTPYGSDVVAGIQGRYFIPILPLLFICLENDVLIMHKNIDNNLVMVFAFLQARTILFIVNFTIF